jgi:hypothetical protein
MVLTLIQQTPIVVRIAPTRDPTGIADVLLKSLGVTGLLILVALLAGLVFAGILFLIRSRRPLDH